MIKKLRIKFMIAAMSSFLAVLLVIIVGINVANYSHTVADADHVIQILSENRGRFPNDPPPELRDERDEMSPEAPYETRYFSVLMDESGQVIQTETKNIAAINATQAIQMAKSAAAEGKNSGFIDIYRYSVFSEPKGQRVIFLDCSSRLNSLWDFLLVSCTISLVATIVVFLLLLFSSARIIRPIADSYEKQKRFITDASHELKTPLTIIHADSEVLESDLGENEWLNDIKKQTNRLTSLTNDLVCLARMEEDPLATVKIDFPISDVVEEISDSFRVLAQTQHKSFRIRIQPLLSFYGNNKQIEQLITILLDNALKYSPEHGEIELILEKQGKSVHLSVSNTVDDHIQPDQIPRFFDRFYRADSARSPEIQGHGLGLSIANAIVSIHGGRVQARLIEHKKLLVTASFP